MPYRFDEADIKSVSSLLSNIKGDKERLRQQMPFTPKVWFRGLRDQSRTLIPTFHRYEYRPEDEIHLMNLFKQNAYEFLDYTPNNQWEWMFLMRHHGLPSRLMDWSENPIIGLYFAVRPRATVEQETTDGVLWCMLPSRLDNWAIGWPENNPAIPMFTAEEAEWPLGENEAISNYLPLTIRQRPSEPQNRPPPAAGICVRTNRRMQVQLGVFTIHHADITPLENVGDGSHIWRYKIPRDRKRNILEELRIMGITERALFPNLDNVAKEASDSLGGH